MKSYSFKRRFVYFLLYISGISWLFLKFRKRNSLLHVYGHRVLNPNTEINKFFINSGHAISRTNFKRKIKFLTNNFSATNIHDLDENSFLVSFDDGYKDNLNIALPVLEASKINLHIFVIGNIIKNRAFFWPDILGYIFYKIEGKYKFNFSNQYFYFSSKKDKINSYLKICNILKEQNNIFIENAVNSIIKTVKCEPNIIFDDLYITEKDILVNNNGVSYGAHSFNHENLCLLSNEELGITINDSIKYISELIGKEVGTFAYPYGIYNKNVTNYFQKYKPCEYSFTTKVNNVNSNYEMNRVNLNLNPYFVFHVEISGAFNEFFSRKNS
tara:strand:+ start:5000 stop:5983 length:984 start_codon:yes stop_codon:yes gene_type:complete